MKRIQEVTVQFSVDNGNTCSSIRLADPLPIQPVPVGYGTLPSVSGPNSLIPDSDQHFRLISNPDPNAGF